MASEPPKVFISYSRDSAEHEQRVLKLANELRTHGGVDAWIDRYGSDPIGFYWSLRKRTRDAFLAMKRRAKV